MCVPSNIVTHILFLSRAEQQEPSVGWGKKISLSVQEEIERSQVWAGKIWKVDVETALTIGNYIVSMFLS